MKKTYYDMDGTLANFDGKPNALQRFAVEPGFFTDLAPTSLCEALSLATTLPEVAANTHILSASPNEQADADKMIWLKANLPHIPAENIHIIRGGAGADERKAAFAKDGSILVDDYSKNLITWEQAGGIGVKALNGNNGSGRTWKGETLVVVMK